MARSVSLGRGERPEYVEQFIHAIPLVWVVLRRLPVLLCLGRLLAGIFHRFVHEPQLKVLSQQYLRLWSDGKLAVGELKIQCPNQECKYYAGNYSSAVE